MRLMKTTLALVAVLAGILVSTSALAHGGRHFHHRPRVSVGFVFGAPAFWYYPPPYYYYYPRVVAVPAEPTVYIERGDAYTPPEQTQGYWYYCPEAKAYYPYVKQCAGGWQRVNPQPPGG